MKQYLHTHMYIFMFTVNVVIKFQGGYIPGFPSVLTPGVYMVDVKKVPISGFPAEP